MIQKAVTDRRVTLGLTFVVAFCSIAYELVYSELLTVFYGGTVLRYSITIGLYLFSMGVGALLSTHLDDPVENFLRTEVYLAVAGPAGAGVIILLNSFPDVTFAAKPTLTLVAAHIPILVVGVLSGFEIPLLNNLLAEREQTVFAALGRLYPRSVLRRLLGVGFDVSEADQESFSEVLGVDYLGSLAGTVIYALVLFPTYGLVVTVLVLGLLNALAALSFAGWTLWGRAWVENTGGVNAETAGKSHGEFSADGGQQAGPEAGDDRWAWRPILLVALVVTGGYAGLVANAGAVDSAVTGAYIGDRIESEYRPDRVDVSVQSFDRTPYQRVTRYQRTIAGHADAETCLRLDRAIQLCDSWVDSYHSGLVDVPMSAFEDPSSVDVLLVGGGDYVAVKHLRRYGVSVDHVDIDGEFMRMARQREYLRQFNDGAYRYERLNTTTGDAFTYLRRTDERYDLVILDVPGARNDDSMRLYSTEFYRLLNRHLTDRGIAVTWSYSSNFYGQHHKTLVNTLRAAGFDRSLPYAVYEDFDDDGERERGEQFYLLSDDGMPTPDLSRSRSGFLDETAEEYDSWEWQPLTRYRGIEPNSVFDPNYDIIVDK